MVRIVGREQCVVQVAPLENEGLRNSRRIWLSAELSWKGEYKCGSAGWAAAQGEQAEGARRDDDDYCMGSSAFI